MNYLHFLAFFVFALSALVSGVRIHLWANKSRESVLNRSVFAGEALLLGSSWIVGAMMFLGMVHLYRPVPLWGLVLANFLFLSDKKVRNAITTHVFGKVKFDLPLIGFCLFMALFIFRNCFFLMDIDSILGYAFTHKVWLAAGTNLTGDDTSCWPIFLPQFNSVPYALGFSLFGDNTLFAGLISTFWRVIASLLMFGYLSYRLGRWYGLAGVMMMLLDIHMFYSGLNSFVIVNSALVALGLAASYNLWEARAKGSCFRLVLGFVFLSQMPANKYQSIWMVIFLTAMGLGFQPDPVGMVKKVLKEKRWIILLSVATVLTAIWYLKTFIITGTPLFFKFAGNVGGLGWTRGQENVFLTLLGGLPLTKALKYISFNFIWAGVYPLKYLWFIFAFLPFVVAGVLLRSKADREFLTEFLFWMGLAFLTLLGVTLAAYYDPRYYRFPMGIFTFSAVFALYYVLAQVIRIKQKWIVVGIILVLSVPRFSVAFESGSFGWPSLKDNINILLNKLTFEESVDKYYPDVSRIKKVLADNPDKADSIAYYIDDTMQFSLLYLPLKPIVSVWRSSLVKWDSYQREELILRDLEEHGIKWVLAKGNAKDGPRIYSAAEMAKILKTVDRYPKNALNVGDYGFPPELKEIHYQKKHYR